jgi:flagellar hook-associated protein 2
MDITATDDGSGHLVLTHDNYGSDYSFTISEDASSGNKLWTGGDQTVNNGVDVAGTINGEAATGSGQILKGDDEESNIDGLVIKYTGIAENLYVGDVKLTLGTAELFDRVLFNITDSYEGYAAFKQDSLQNSIDGFETRIEEMEARLDLKMENMINKFVAMETALSVMQSQSEWLTGQINASYSGWG